jgi:hypothetical protein
MKIFSNPLPENKLRRKEKLFLIFNKLSDDLGDDISSVDLLKAASDLIKLSKKEYRTKSYKEVKGISDYYEEEVDMYMRHNEYMHLQPDYEQDINCYYSNHPRNYVDFFKAINVGSHEIRWGF